MSHVISKLSFYYRCTPLYLHGQLTEYYYLSETQMKLSCEDAKCQNCKYDLKSFDYENPECLTVSGSSIQVGRPLIYSWQTSEETMSYVANVFFSETYCAFYSRYVEPQVLSTHVNLGWGNGTCRNSIDFRISNNQTSIQKAFWVSSQSIFT